MNVDKAPAADAQANPVAGLPQATRAEEVEVVCFPYTAMGVELLLALPRPAGGESITVENDEFIQSRRMMQLLRLENS